ncbi:RNA-directed DNA polymerase, eukaryota, partial [Tanacetum coccineum]
VDGEKHLKHLKSQDSMIYLKYQRTMMMSGLLLGTLHELIMVLISDYVEGRPGDKVEGDDECTNKDQWKVCNDYGTVIDVFIPNKRSKSRKRFAFVRFIKVSNLDRLVENLNIIWMGHFHLSANRARFDRPVVSPALKQIPGIMSRPKYVQPNAIPKEKVSSPPYLLKPSLVIDDSCLVSKDLDNCVMGEVRQVTSINNMQVLLSNEGFHNTHIVYLGGLWVMIELNSPKAKANLLQHVGVASWFSHIGNAQLDFAAKERIVWVDIEGVPLNAWSHPTFKKIGSIWGEMVDLEEENDTLFARKRICIKTSHMENILESFKLIVKGKVFWVRAKELFTWVPSFKTVPVNEVSLDDESVKANDMDNRAFDNEEESESEVVSDTVFGDYDGDQAAQGPDNQNEVPLMAKATSSDPFNIYGMLNKRTKKGKASKSDSSVPYPPGFTPALNVKANNKETDPVEYNHLSGKSENSNSKVLEEGEMSANSAPHVNSSAVSKSKEGGSILEILEEMITVGQTMGFSMEGCVKDMEKIIGTQGELGETKMENISTLDAKYLWGNYCFDHIVSEACGNSGGIICIWDTNMFKKDNHIISDNFVALYGTWIPNNMKLLLISVYAPQVRSSKRLLWNYLSSLIIRWKGECLVMGDFNEVRSIDERWGSTFNKQGADLFNSFISSSGLIDIQMEGYSFTWAHPSASKMSKLDRFLLSNGLLSFFPHLSAVCLDRHLSDHRPILLKEVHSDFGPTPFRFFHSWLDLPGFDEMISSSWASFNLDDSNAMIRFKKKLKLLKVEIRKWTKDFKEKQEGQSRDLNLKLRDIDKTLDQGGVTDDLLLSRMELMKQIQDIHKSKHRDSMQKAKVRWAIEGDENSKYFHAIINKKRANLSVKGVMVDGDWVVDPILVKKEFRDHFADRFQDPGPRKGRINFQFPNRLSSEQVADLETRISTDEIQSAVWGCGVDKSPGPDGFTFDFFRKYWTVVGTDFCSAVLWFFDHGEFAIGSHPISAAYNSPWGTIIKEVKALNDKSINLKSIKIAQLQISSMLLSQLLFVARLGGGPEAQQLEQLTNLLDSVSLSNMEDRRSKAKGPADKNKQVVPYQPKPKPNPLKRKENPNKDQACHHCHVVGHWKRNCPLYIEELRANKKKSEPGAAVSGILKKKGNYLMGINICKWAMEHKQLLAQMLFDLVLPSGLVLKLNNCYYAPSIVRGVVSLSCLLDLGFHHTIASNGISVSLNDLLGLIHTDVCGPLRHVSRKGASYFLTFTDDFSRYGYVYLLKHKHEVFKTFKVFKAEVELQLGKKIKALRSDRGGEYLSQEFKDYLSENGIVQNLTSPYTPQQNGVSKRRNRTLLDMVRSMFNLTTLPLSFWDYALESAVSYS